ncbi:MAG: Crp/Fnr family transcriptional regulator [Anaerolineae bacterium]|nr:Crp/Fnr family transcriptional regulator [Anaerolineae bacterium]
MATEETKRALAKVPYLAQLEPALIDIVAGNARQQEYTAGQVVITEGEQDVALYVVHTGWLKAVKSSPEGREQVLHFLGPGEVFNAIGVLIESRNPATVIALEPSVVWMIPQQVILYLIDHHPELGRVIVQHLAMRVQQLIRMVEDLSLHTLEARLARYLIEQSTSEQMQRPRWATQAELASRLGTVPDVLHRALRTLAKENLIRVQRHEITILDPAGLKAKAGLI